MAAIILLGVAPLQAQELGEASSRRHFVGSSAFVLANVALAGRADAPDFYQLNYGYRLTDRDAVSVEAITWRYTSPVGIPYGPSYESPDEAYPGYVREAGIGVAYQRLLWRNFYSGVHAAPMLKQYFDEHDARIQNGFRLFLTVRTGYHLPLLQGRFFLEPSVAATHWPIDTNFPAAFEERERKWPNYFLFEPGLHFGMNF